MPKSESIKYENYIQIEYVRYKMFDIVKVANSIGVELEKLSYS